LKYYEYFVAYLVDVEPGLDVFELVLNAVEPVLDVVEPVLDVVETVVDDIVVTVVFTLAPLT
jgi:hypothetical protein